MIPSFSLVRFYFTLPLHAFAERGPQSCVNTCLSTIPPIWTRSKVLPLFHLESILYPMCITSNRAFCIPCLCFLYDQFCKILFKLFPVQLSLIYAWNLKMVLTIFHVMSIFSLYQSNLSLWIHTELCLCFIYVIYSQ